MSDYIETWEVKLEGLHYIPKINHEFYRICKEIDQKCVINFMKILMIIIVKIIRTRGYRGYQGFT